MRLPATLTVLAHMASMIAATPMLEQDTALASSVESEALATPAPVLEARVPQRFCCVLSTCLPCTTTPHAVPSAVVMERELQFPASSVPPSPSPIFSTYSHGRPPLPARTAPA